MDFGNEVLLSHPLFRMARVIVELFTLTGVSVSFRPPGNGCVSLFLSPGNERLSFCPPGNALCRRLLLLFPYYPVFIS